MDPAAVKKYYEQQGVVLHYAQAAASVGLWQSEHLWLSRVFNTEQSLLELGCGAGRIAIGLFELGYHSIIATDYSKEMVQAARNVAAEKGYSIPFRVADACLLKFESGSFDGVIFGFNGLMQIPGKDRRRMALAEIFRVLKPGGYFFFTTHDRENPKHRKHWKKEARDWNKGKQRAEYEEFGDRIGETDWGEMFIHIPHRNEIEEELILTGFRVVKSAHRREVTSEPYEVREFSDECILWMVRKPLESEP
jgi:SAM-dependent methyltransferase